MKKEVLNLDKVYGIKRLKADEATYEANKRLVKAGYKGEPSEKLNVLVNDFSPLISERTNKPATDAECLIYVAGKIKEGVIKECDPKIKHVALAFHEAYTTGQADIDDLDKELNMLKDYSNYKKPVLTEA